MDGVSEELLREPFQLGSKRARSCSHPDQPRSPTSRLHQHRKAQRASCQQVTTAAEEVVVRPSSSTSEPLLFELVSLDDTSGVRPQSCRFGAEGLRIGRDHNCSDLTLPFKAVSRLHCVLSVLGDEVFVHDLSYNGTFINGRLVGRGRCSVLHPFDKIFFLNPTVEEAVCCSFEMVPLPGLSSSAFKQVEGLQRYELGPIIGQGSYASVRLGVDRETGSLVAVKLIECRGPRSGEAAEALHTEIEMMRSMDNVRVVRMLNVFESGGAVALVMEYVRGGDLFDYVVGRGRNPFTEAEARHLFVQLLEGVAYIHGRSIIHCDLKPENVLVAVLRSESSRRQRPTPSAGTRGPPHACSAYASDSPSSTTSSPLKLGSGALFSVVENHQARAPSISPFDIQLKLTDFGVAQYEGEVCGSGAFPCGGGTPIYAAPELVHASPEGATRWSITSAVDVWSLGVLLYILCSGTVPKHPRPGASVSLNRSMGSLSLACKDLIVRMMAVDPAQRASLEEVCHHPWLDGISVRGAPAVPGTGEDSEDVLSVTTKLSPRPALFSRTL